MNLTFDARSYKGRAKLFVIAVLFIAALLLPPLQCGAEGAEAGHLRRNFLLTSHNPESYSLFEINGNILYARGRYTDDRIDSLFFAKEEGNAAIYKMRMNSDGSYEAEIALPDGYRYTNICIRLASGAVFGYRLNYNNGWYFPDNGLSETNKTVFDSITDASPESTGYYLSPTADADEIAAVQEQIKLISDSVTEGAESDYEKARLLCRYVAQHFYYDHDARITSVTEANVSLSEVLKTARTVCTGFADLYCALLQAQGIDAVNIKGGSTGGNITYELLTEGVQNHEFTAFYYDAEQRWVWVDSCWCGSGDYENGEYISDIPHQKFFDITDEALALDHRADYAQRRDFFNALPADKTDEEESGAETTDAPAETTAVTPEKTENTTVLTTSETALPSETAENNTDIPENENNTVLIVIIGVLGAAVIVTGVFVVRNLIKVNKS